MAEVVRDRLQRDVGRVVRVVRKLRGITEEEMCRLLAQRTEDQWSEMMLLNLETGRKATAAGLLVDLGKILQIDPLDPLVRGDVKAAIRQVGHQAGASPEDLALSLLEGTSLPKVRRRKRKGDKGA